VPTSVLSRVTPSRELLILLVVAEFQNLEGCTTDGVECTGQTLRPPGV
jgi:hypothetical protein